MLKYIWVPIVVILVVIGGRYLYYNNQSSYAAPDRPLPEVEFDASAVSPRLEAVDNPKVSKGVVAIDFNHSNALFPEELNILLSKVVNRGFSYELILPQSSEVSFEEGSGADDQSLAGKLRYAQALILPLPRVEYTPEEVAEIRNFVEKGGRVLIIGDPTRTVIVEALNSIAGAFGIIYANDYLYSQTNNDNNYRNVVYSNFQDSPLTKGLDKDHKVIFYAGGSITAPDHEIIMGDETTHSSISEGGRKPASAALTTNDQVLALTDLTFFTEPYSAAESNGILINNIADFLSGGRRDFELKDFPFFLNPQVDLVYDNSLVLNSQLDKSVKLKEFLEKHDHTVTLTDKVGDKNDTIFVGRFDKIDTIKDYLAEGGITILGLDQKSEAEAKAEEAAAVEEGEASDQPPGKEARFVTGRIQIQGIGDLERGGSTLFYLDRQEGRNVLIMLSDTPETNADAFDILFENRLSECRLSDTMAVCQTQEPGDELTPSLRSKRINNILVVGGDTGRPRADQQTGALEFTAVLSDSYQVDTWLISKKGSPELDQLLDYDAIIWTTGDYWDDSISEKDANLLTKYIELGGNLILSGASIGFDWDHTTFLTKVAHADYLNFAEQSDLEVILPDHPIAAGFTEGETIPLTSTPVATSTETTSDEPVVPDVINYTSDARVIFIRGLESDDAGAPSVIAYEDDRSKVAYFAFPIYQLATEQRALLVNNTVKWFTKKPLPLPAEEDYLPYEPGAPTPEVTPTVEPTGEPIPTVEPTGEATPTAEPTREGGNGG
ncbi:MAG: hypothetical protein U0401_19940 [Anaerolineae bacterium]